MHLYGAVSPKESFHIKHCSILPNNQICIPTIVPETISNMINYLTDISVDSSNILSIGEHSFYQSSLDVYIDQLLIKNSIPCTLLCNNSSALQYQFNSQPQQPQMLYSSLYSAPSVSSSSSLESCPDEGSPFNFRVYADDIGYGLVSLSHPRNVDISEPPLGLPELTNI